MPFQSLPFIRASSRDKAWQAALLPTLMGLYYDSPHSNHIVLWPSCPITLFSSHREHPEDTLQIHLKIQISVAGFKKQCFSMQFPLVIRHNQWKQQTGSVAKEKKKLSARAFKYFLLSNWIFPVRNSRKCKLKPQWGITSHVLKWLLSKRQEISSGEGIKGILCTLLMGI